MPQKREGKEAKSKREIGNEEKETVEEEVEARQEREEEKATWNCKRRKGKRERTWIPIGAVTWRGELPITRQRQERDDCKTSRTLCMGGCCSL